MKNFLIEAGKGLMEFILSIILGLLLILVYWAFGLWELIKLPGKLLLRKPLIVENFSPKTVLDVFTAPFVLIGYIWLNRGLKRELGKVNS